MKEKPNQTRQWMSEAVALARASMSAGGGPFGAVVVFEERVVGRGQNQVTRALDPTAHAEVLAIRSACQALARFDLRGCQIYTSCEPCPMCLAASYWARLDSIFYACTRADASSIGFDDDFIYQQMPLEIAARSMPMNQVAREDAFRVFEEWTAKADKIPY